MPFNRMKTWVESAFGLEIMLLWSVSNAGKAFAKA